MPLANLIRPTSLKEYQGQEKIKKTIQAQSKLSSIILWGPPGCGKTTLARIIAKKYEYVELSAVNAGKADLQQVANKSKLLHQPIVLFLDEIHRFNKAQQDFLLPHVEKGNIILIGATTENPSFEVNGALLSRCQVFTLEPLSKDQLTKILHKGIEQIKKTIDEETINTIISIADGDARKALNILEAAANITQDQIAKEHIEQVSQRMLRYDKNGEEHYNIISALHKSLRDSDEQAAVYWTMRMLEAGEDPNYIIRRMIRFASEDIGLADPRALIMATSALQAINHLGYPECNTALTQTAIYLAKAPKSNAVYEATNSARQIIQQTGNLPVPLNIRNAPTKLMKDLGYNKGYKYAHDFKDAKVDQQRLPKEIEKQIFYKPQRGFEERWKS